MTFDWTISLGNILSLSGFVLGGVVFVLMMRGDMLVLGVRVAAVELALRDMAHSQLAIATAITKVEALDERMNVISRRLDDHINLTNQRGDR